MATLCRVRLDQRRLTRPLRGRGCIAGLRRVDVPILTRLHVEHRPNGAASDSALAEPHHGVPLAHRAPPKGARLGRWMPWSRGWDRTTAYPVPTVWRSQVRHGVQHLLFFIFALHMIQPQTYLRVADNSGARTLMCIRVLGSNMPNFASLGDTIIAVVKEALPNGSIKKSDVVRAVIVRSKRAVRRKSGMSIRFDDNAAVLITKDGNPRGTRIFGPVSRELREKNFAKIISLAPEVV